MAVDTYALTTVLRARNYLNLTDDADIQVGALSIYNSSTDATAATVQVTDTTMVLVVTAGVNAGTSTLTFADANKDTLGELVTAIGALAKGWVVTQYSPSDSASTDLTLLAATACLGVLNVQTLYMTNTWRFERLVDGASAAIESFCGRQFLTRSYSERYDGNGRPTLVIGQYPMTAVTLLAMGTTNALLVSNASTDATYATVAASSTGLTLAITGGANAGTDSLLYATYGTMTLLAAAIIALGKNWTGTVLSSFGPIVSTEIKPTGGMHCLNENASLQIPDDAKTEYEFYSEGLIYCPSGFRSGHKNILVKYTAGYASTPYDLEQIVWEIVAENYNRMSRNTEMKSEKIADYAYTVGDITISRKLLDRLRRWVSLAPAKGE